MYLPRLFGDVGLIKCVDAANVVHEVPYLCFVLGRTAVEARTVALWSQRVEVCFGESPVVYLVRTLDVFQYLLDLHPGNAADTSELSLSFANCLVYTLALPQVLFRCLETALVHELGDWSAVLVPRAYGFL